MNTNHKYETTYKSIMEWANSELEHVGRIVAVHDPDLQYSYALSTVNGMAHLKDALYQMVTDVKYNDKKEDLQRTHDAVVRVMKHLIKDFSIDLETIKQFNTRKVLSNLSYLENSNTKNISNISVRSPKNVKNVPNNYISNVSTLGSNTRNSTLNSGLNMNAINANASANAMNANVMNANAMNANAMNANANAMNANANATTLNVSANAMNSTNRAMNIGAMNANLSNSNSMNTVNLNVNNSKNKNKKINNTTTPALRSSIVSNANSMSQKLRGGKRRNRSNRSRK